MSWKNNLLRINIVRRSHFLIGQREGYIFSIIRSFFIIWPISVLGAGPALIQALTALFSWAAIILIATPSQSCISPRLHIPSIPIGTFSRCVGALFGFRFIEVLPVAFLFLYRVGQGTLPDALLVLIIIIFETFSFGIIRALVDDLCVVSPRLFYRSPFLTIALIPSVMGVVGQRVGMGPSNAAIICSSALLSLFPLYLNSVRKDGPILLTITVPNLSVSLYKKGIYTALIFSGISCFFGFLALQVTGPVAAVAAVSVSIICCCWLSFAWGGGTGRVISLFLLCSVLNGVVSGIISAEQSTLSIIVIAVFSSIIFMCSLWRLRTLTDSQLSRTLSR